MPRIDPRRAPLIDGAVQAFRRYLPPTWRVTRGDAAHRADAVVTITAPDGRTVTLRVVARVAPPSAIDMEAAVASAGADPLVVVAPFLSARTRDLLASRGASFADGTGNLRLVTADPAIYLESRGADRAPRPGGSTPRALLTLRGPATARVVRALCDLAPPFGVRQLADLADIPVATVSRVTALLERGGTVERSADRAIAFVDWRALIEAWARDRPLARAPERVGALEPRGLPALGAKLGRLPRHAVTGSLALAGLPDLDRVAPTALAMVYADDPAGAVATLDLVRVDAAANVWLIGPDDPVVYDRTRTVAWPMAVAGEDPPMSTAVAPAQAAADLLTSPGRGPAEADALMRWMEANEDVWRVRPGA